MTDVVGEYDQTFLNIQQRLINYTSLLASKGGRTKNNDGSYSTSGGIMLNYVRLAELVESLMLRDSDADKLLHVVKAMSTEVSLPTHYKTLVKKVMSALKDR